MLFLIWLNKGVVIIKKLKNMDIAIKVSVISVIVNVLLSVLKLFAGIFASSSAMISDAIHTISDVLSTFVVMIGIVVSNKKADKCHPYGHERYECVAAVILAAMLFFTGIGIGYGGLQKMLLSIQGDLKVPGTLALAAAIISIVVKEWMFWYTKAAAKKINSAALMADAWHHRSDALSSVGSFAGILGARFGIPILDPLACIIISLLIIKASYDIFVDAINKMVDRSCDEFTVGQMNDLIMQQEGVHVVNLVNTRLFGSKIYVDVEIGVNKEITLEDANRIAEEVRIEVERSFCNIKHCLVHVNPF